MSLSVAVKRAPRRHFLQLSCAHPQRKGNRLSPSAIQRPPFCASLPYFARSRTRVPCIGRSFSTLSPCATDHARTKLRCLYVIDPSTLEAPWRFPSRQGFPPPVCLRPPQHTVGSGIRVQSPSFRGLCPNCRNHHPASQGKESTDDDDLYTSSLGPSRTPMQPLISSNIW